MLSDRSEKALSGTGLSPEQKNHVRQILDRFCLKFIAKYAKGQIEHGGDMWKKPGMLYCLEEELLDFLSYFATIETQLAERDPQTHRFMTRPLEGDK